MTKKHFLGLELLRFGCSLATAYAATVLVTSWLAYRFYEMPAQSRIRAMLLVPKPSVKAIANSRA